MNGALLCRLSSARRHGMDGGSALPLLRSLQFIRPVEQETWRARITSLKADGQKEKGFCDDLWSDGWVDFGHNGS